MAGYGNKTRMDPEWDGQGTRYGLSDNSDPYQGASKYKSGTVGGAGFGNKTRPEPNLESYDNSNLRFGDRRLSTEPYSGGSAEYKSGTVGGAGFGNKTSKARKDSASSTHGDSVIGKALEKLGEVTHSEKLVEKGHERRASKGAFDDVPAPAPMTVADV